MGLMYIETPCKLCILRHPISEFELQLRYYVHFRMNTHGKSYEPPYSPCYVYYSITAVLLQGRLWH